MANRQLAILRILERGGKATLQELAEKTESSKKTIERDLLDLFLDYPIETECGKYGGVRLDKKSLVLCNVFTKSEIEYIATSLVGIADKDSELHNSIMQKLFPS